MKYIAAYTLLVLGGNDSPSEDDLSKFLKSSECEVNADQIKAVVAALKGKALHELINNGMSKLGSVCVGGGSGGATNDAPADEKKEESVKEEEEDIDIGDLFG